MKYEPDRIAALYFKRVGDSLVATPTLRTIKKEWPNCRLTILCESQVQRVFQHNPFINEITVFEPHTSLFKILSNVRNQQKPDTILDFMSNGKTAIISYFSRAQVRVGIGYKGRKWAYNKIIPVQNKSNPIYSVTHKLNISDTLGINNFDGEKTDFFLMDEDISFSDSLFAVHGFDNKHKIIAFNVLSRKTYKKWPLEYFSQVVKYLLEGNRFTPIILSTPDDDGSTKTVANLAGLSDKNILRIPNLGKLAAVLKKCRVLVGNDGGAKHVAIAMETPTVTIFGAEPSEYWTPQNNSIHIALSKWNSDISTDSKNTLLQIEPQEVIDSIESLLQEK